MPVHATLFYDSASDLGGGPINDDRPDPGSPDTTTMGTPVPYTHTSERLTVSILGDPASRERNSSADSPAHAQEDESDHEGAEN